MKSIVESLNAALGNMVSERRSINNTADVISAFQADSELRRIFDIADVEIEEDIRGTAIKISSNKTVTITSQKFVDILVKSGILVWNFDCPVDINVDFKKVKNLILTSTDNIWLSADMLKNPSNRFETPEKIVVKYIKDWAPAKFGASMIKCNVFDMMATASTVDFTAGVDCKQLNVSVNNNSDRRLLETQIATEDEDFDIFDWLGKNANIYAPEINIDLRWSAPYNLCFTQKNKPMPWYHDDKVIRRKNPIKVFKNYGRSGYNLFVFANGDLPSR